jgi:hypothetical protein
VILMNIFVGLELPVDVRIDYDLVPAPLPSKAARQVEEERLTREVVRAIQTWYYENYC